MLVKFNIIAALPRLRMSKPNSILDNHKARFWGEPEFDHPLHLVRLPSLIFHCPTSLRGLFELHTHYVKKAVESRRT
jgi:hypothetical protein